MAKGPTIRLIAAVAAFAVVAAAAVVVVGDNRPRYDEKEYDEVGARVAAGLGLTYDGGRLYFQSHPPLYAAFVGAAYAVHRSRAAVACAQGLFAAAALLFVYGAARRAFGQKTATLTSFVFAVYLPTAFYVTRLLSEVLFAALLAAAAFWFLAALARERPRGWELAAPGFLFGLAALARGVALFNAAGLGAYLLCRRDAPAGKRVLRAVWFAVGVGAAVLPWSFYLYGQTGKWVLVDTKGPEIFWLGNNAATPTHHAWDILGSGAAAPPAALLKPGVAAFDTPAVYQREAWTYIARHPGQTFVRFLGKAADTWEMERLAVGGYRAGHFERGREPFLRAFVTAEVAASALALLLFWLGLALAPRSPWRAVVLNLVVTTTAAYSLTVSHPRYNFPLVVVGAAAIAYVFTLIKDREARAAIPRRRWFVAAAAAFLQLAVFARAAWLYVARGS